MRTTMKTTMKTKFDTAMKPVHAAFLVAALSLASAGLAQDGTFPPPQGPGQGGPGAPGQGGPGQGGMRGDPAQMAERFFAQDANGDGKVTREEATGPFAERVFERADLNKDGAIDRAEMAEFVKSLPARGGQGARGGREGGAGGAPVNLEGAMKQVNGAYRALRGSALDANSRKADLEAVQRLQMGLVASKAAAGSVPMSPAAKAKFGEDKAAYEKEFRTQFLRSMLLSIEIEKAILDGDAARAKAALAELHEAEESGHELFQDEGGEEGEGAERPRARGSRGEAPGA